jgi:hypothetical protein
MPLRNSHRDVADPPTIPCPMCSDDVSVEALYTCSDCGRVGCEACVDISYMICPDCMADDAEDMEDEEW